VTADFDQLVDLTGMSPEDRARLARVHELLVAAGPPPELPSVLDRPPADVGEAKVIAFPGRRRAAAAILVAAACFGGGYLLANQTRPASSPHAVRVVRLQGEQNSLASLRVGASDTNGNWPMQLTVSGLPPLTSRNAHYILMVTQAGKPTWVCGMFRVGKNGSTTVAFDVPYRITDSTQWAVTKMTPGTQFPGHVVMTTA